ncbi:hypothetical protein [Agromyces bauzanensis]|uniref:Uncharacterized protein n=1 Tax=Agromyces bauzanensis TaxID=1308924 RepID=A0A917PTW6_9MICO|nr:hypothetical protein [Agromyces bauzanensis]GGJ91630.1 hypothetical protein GCM10011372_32630 [Agromyces bauzanensis]
MATPFDDPEFNAQLAKMGVVHRPGLADEMLGELAPLLSAEGIDLDNLEDTDLDDLNAALARATEQRNLALFTPVGAQRAAAFAVLARFTEAIAEGDDERARAVLAAIGPEPVGDTPAVAQVIGASLGLLDARHTDPALGAALAGTRVPKWDGRQSRAAAVDILALASKGRSFDALQSLHLRRGGLAVFEGAALVVAASLIAQAAAEGVDVGPLAGRVLSRESAPPSGKAAPTGSVRPSGTVGASGVLPPSSAFARGEAPAARAFAKPSGNRASRRGSPARDRRTLREFSAWLERQPSIAAPSVSDETNVLRALLMLAREAGLDALDPDDIDPLIDVLFEDEDPEASDMLENALETLHDYVHFRLETARDADGWEDAHEVVEEATAEMLPGSGVIADAIAGAEQLDAEERRAALAGTRIVAAVRDLLAWIGTGRPVSPSGGVRRADIQPVAAMIGVSAVGVAKYPSEEGELLPLIDIDLDAPLPEPATTYARSMYEVPMLSAWWEALTIADVITRTATRVRPGPAATEWLAHPLPPLDMGDMVVGVFVAEVLTEQSAGPIPMFEAAITTEAVRRLMVALAPESVDDDEAESSELARILTPRALQRLKRLEDAGLLQANADGVFEVPVALRGAVARGVLLSMAMLYADVAEE